MSLFGPENTQTGEISAGHTPKAGVVDRSGEVLGNAMAGVFNNLGAAVKKEKDKASAQALNNFADEVSRLGLAQQQGMSASQARVMQTKAYRTYLNNGGDAKAAASLMNTINAGNIGKGTTHAEDPQHAANKAMDKELASLGLINEFTTLDEKTVVRDKYMERKRIEETLAAKVTHYENLNKLGAADDTRARREMQKHIPQLFNAHRSEFNHKLRAIAKAVDGNGMSQEEGQVAITEAYGEAVAKVEELRAANLAPKAADGMLAIAKDYRDKYTKVITGELNLEALKNGQEIKRIIIEQQLDGATATMAMTSKIFAGIRPEFMNGKTYAELANSVSQAMAAVDNGQNVESDFNYAKNEAPVRHYLKQWRKAAVDKTEGEGGEEHQRQLDASMMLILESFANDTHRVKSPAEIAHLVEFIASPEAASVVKGLKGRGLELPQNVVDRMQEVFQTQYLAKAQPIIESEWERKIEAISPQLQDAIREQSHMTGEAEEGGTVNPQDFIEVSWQNGSVVFSAKKGSPSIIQQHVKDMQGELATITNQLVHAEANLKGVDPKEVWESSTKSLFDAQDDFSGSDEGVDTLEGTETDDDLGDVNTSALKDALGGNDGGDEDLGSLSAKYESRGDFGAYGKDRTGGPSYGKYQIATRTGTFKNYESYLRKNHPSTYEEIKAIGGEAAARKGGKRFISGFKELMKNPEHAKTQHEFIKATHYDVAVDKLGSSFDESKASKTMKDVLWSTSVQHGPSGAAKIYKRALKRVGAEATEADIIRAIYQERGADGGGRYFGSSTSQVRNSVVNRFQSEANQALQSLEG